MDNDFLVALLYEYFYREQFRLDDDLIQLSNNISFRQADALDHLEMIMAQVRAQCTNDIAQDVYRLISIVKSGGVTL